MYTRAMPKTKTPAPLTVQLATRQARKHVDALMPGVMATVDSTGTADPQTLAPLMRTVVTFPEHQQGAAELAARLGTLSGVVSKRVAGSSITIIRER